MSTVRGREGVKECVAKCGIRWRENVTVIHDKVNPNSGSQPGVSRFGMIRRGSKKCGRNLRGQPLV